jgi:hypothetical protein
MSKICHAHCPDDSGGFLAVLAVVLGVVLAVIVANVIESMFWAIIAVAAALGATGIAYLAYVLRRDRWQAPEPRELAAPRSSSGLSRSGGHRPFQRRGGIRPRFRSSRRAGWRRTGHAADLTGTGRCQYRSAMSCSPTCRKARGLSRITPPPLSSSPISRSARHHDPR